MTKWIILSILIAFSILFACLKSVWTGFVYLGVATLCLLFLYVIYIRVKMYIRDYYKNFEKSFIVYKAEYVNQNNISIDDFEKEMPMHLKKFKKLLRKEKIVDIFKILFVLTLFALCLFGLITIK